MTVTTMPNRLSSRKEKAEVGAEPKRDVAETGYRIKCQAQHFAERILGVARKTLGPLVLDANLTEADPAAEAAHKAMFLAQTAHRLNDLAVHQAEFARIDRESPRR